MEILASGDIQESEAYPVAAEADNPLNTHKLNLGRPEHVQQAAIIALITIYAENRISNNKTIDILESVFCSSSPDIRKAAYAAAGTLSKAPEGVLLGVLAGLRDNDQNAARRAFVAFAEQADWEMNRNHWSVFLMGVQVAQNSADPILRRHAATALLKWMPKTPNDRIKTKALNLQRDFANDICWSVRKTTPLSSD